MGHALVITVRFHEGRYHGSKDWPPSPGRLFQALVAGAAQGRLLSGGDCDALEWLEGLGAPYIGAPKSVKGKPLSFWVPNNDLDAKGGDLMQIDKIRVQKPIELRLFDTDMPFLYVWFDVGLEHAAVTRGISERLYRLGRGQDPAWAVSEIIEAAQAQERLDAYQGDVYEPGGRGNISCPTQGTFASLHRRHEATLVRLSWQEKQGKKNKAKKMVQIFSQPPKPYLLHIGYNASPYLLHFDLRQMDDKFAPVPLGRAGTLVDGLRKEAACKLEEHGIAEAERLIVGRGATEADKARRIRVIPIPSIGHSDVVPSIRRIMVEVPRDCPVAIDDIAWAFSGLPPNDPETGEVIETGTLTKSEDTAMARRFLRHARRWRTITAASLSKAERRRIPPDGSAPKKGSERADEQAASIRAVHRAISHAGIRARALCIEVQREPFGRRETGAEAFAAGTRFPKRTLWHLDVTFDRPVCGPLLLGDGRFVGLGLLRPVDVMKDGWEFLATTALPDAPDALCRALRRAIMACARTEFGKDHLPDLVHGHEEDGGPLRGGDRRHLAYSADLARNRLLVLAPHLTDRRKSEGKENRELGKIEKSICKLTRLVAGKEGTFNLVVRPLAAMDPLFRRAMVWESLTDYKLTRYPRGCRRDFLDACKEDVSVECRRRNLPTPDVTVLLPGKDGLSGRLRLTFPCAITGPILLGRTAMRGGGLFSPGS